MKPAPELDEPLIVGTDYSEIMYMYIDKVNYR